MKPLNSIPRLIAVLAALLFLVGCTIAAERPVAVPIDPERPFSPTNLPVVVVTLLPADTPTLNSGASAAATSTAPLPAQSTPTAEDLPQMHVALTPNAPVSQPWQDCSLSGGWVGCDPNAPKLAARLAFFIPSGPAVAVLDLETSDGWSLPSAVGSADPRISWSPDGDQLLAALNDNQYAVYAAGSAPLGSLQLDQDGQPPFWQPDNRLAEPEVVHSAQGAIAQLAQGPDMGWQIVLQPAPGTEPIRLNIETQPSDRLYHLIGFVPGTDLMLGQSYYAGNQVMMQGAQLFTYDVQTGTRTDLEALAPLGWQASYAWQAVDASGSPAMLAFADTGGRQIGLATLTLLNFDTGDLRRPLPAGVAVADLDWQPLQGNLAFSASMFGPLDPPEAAAIFALPAIYLLESETGTVRALTQPPAGARDGLSTWTSDGQWLLYARYYEQGVLEVRAVQPDSGRDHLIASGLAAECPSDGPGCPWGRWLAIQAK